MADSFIGVPVDGVGKQVDTSQVTTTVGPVHRERDVQADPVDPLALANVRGLEATDLDYASIVNEVHSAEVRDLLKQILLTQRAMLMAITHLVSEDGSSRPTDFLPSLFDDDQFPLG